MSFFAKKSKRPTELDIADAINKKQCTIQFGGHTITLKAMTMAQFLRGFEYFKEYSDELKECIFDKQKMQTFLAEKLPLIVEFIQPGLKVDYKTLPLYEALDFIVAFWSVNDFTRVIENFMVVMPSRIQITKDSAPSPK